MESHYEWLKIYESVHYLPAMRCFVANNQVIWSEGILHISMCISRDDLKYSPIWKEIAETNICKA